MGRVNGWVDSRARSKVALLPGVYACRRCRRCRLCRLFARELVLTNSTNGANLWAQVQIYDMATDSWSLGRDLPYSVGSASTAVIGGYVYLCGGILQVDRSGKCILGPGRQRGGCTIWPCARVSKVALAPAGVAVRRHPVAHGCS